MGFLIDRVMVVTSNFVFVPHLNIDNTRIETFEEMRLLGITLRMDLSWKSTTNNMSKRAYKKLWITKRLSKQGADIEATYKKKG